MNNDFEGTPNPLNPTSGSSPIPEPVASPKPATNPGLATHSRPVMPPRPMVAPVRPTPAPTPVNHSGLSSEGAPRLESLDANPAEPILQDVSLMSKSDPATESTGKISTSKPKKKKTGMIVAILACLLIAVGCGVTAILLTLNSKNTDAVPSALGKMLRGDMPKLVSMEGNITITPTNDNTPYSLLTIKFHAGINGNTDENYSNAVVTATLPDKNEFSISINEVRMSDGDLYLKLSGISEALSNYNLSSSTNCVDTPGANCASTESISDCEGDDCTKMSIIMPSPSDSVLDFIGVFDVIDGEWIRIPGSSFKSITHMVPIDNTTLCLIDAAGKLDEYGKNFADAYDKNSFISYSTEKLPVTQKKDQLYQLIFDEQKLAGFINSMSNLGFMNELLACTGGLATNKNVSGDDLTEMIAELPDIYVEVDDNNNFTRVYLDFDLSKANLSSGDAYDIVADISLSYPTDINVNGPEEYIDINEVLSTLLTMFYNGGNSDKSDTSSSIFDFDFSTKQLPVDMSLYF